MSDKWSVYGGFGFVLGEFCLKYPDQTIRIPKTELSPSSPHVIYGISTVDNYNVFDDVTLDISTNLLHFMEVLNKCHTKYGKDLDFTLISTWFVYGSGSTKEKPFTEESQCDPKGFYSITARCREQLLISYCETFGIKYRILRLANVLGKRDKKVSAKKNALQYLIDKMVHHEDIELYDGGEFYRDYIDVHDVSRAIRLCLDDTKYPIINISNGTSHLFKDLIDTVSKHVGGKGNVWSAPTKPHFHSVVQSKDVFISNEKLKSLGYTPELSMEETLIEIIDGYAK